MVSSISIVNSQCLLANFFLLRAINSRLVLTSKLRINTKLIMLAKFRHRYPQGSLVSELVKIDRGTYIVKALVQIDGVVLATALAGANTVENAEDAAKERAIATLFLDSNLNIPQINSAKANSDDDYQLTSHPQAQLDIEPLVKQTVDVPQNSIPATEAMLNSDPVKSTLPSVNQQCSPINEPVEPTPISSNLFGDTFAAEIPEEISLSDNNFDNNVVTTPSELEAMDFNEIKQKTDIEIKRLSWTKDQGKEFLMSHYGKRSRLHLTDEELLEFLRYLEQLPNPIP